MSESLTLAPELVPEYCVAVDIPVLSPTGQLAKAIARRVDNTDGESLPQAPASLAAGSIYLATRITPPNVTQRELAEATETSEGALRNAYQAIALQVDIATETPSGERGIDLHPPQEWPDWICNYTGREENIE